MPELPEVEVVCLGLRSIITDRVIKSVVFSGKKLRLPVPETAILRLSPEQKIIAVNRRAKYLVVTLASGAKLIFHLGMTGKLGVFQSSSPVALHDHLRFALNNDMELRFNDARRFGSVQILAPDDSELDFFAVLGPEPLQGDFSAVYLQEKAAKRQQPLKNFLMDSHIVVGIGNIYANEIPFAAGIAPQRPICQITLSEWQDIVKKTREVLKCAIAAGGSTISDFINASGKPGYFQLQLKVYGRMGKQCNICGEKIQKMVMAGRPTFWCDKCQK